MTATQPAIKIAIIGAGPRGLGAIESLVAALLGRKTSLELTTFDDLQLAGAGPNFDPSQTPHCILNIPMRAVDIPRCCPCPVGILRIGNSRTALPMPTVSRPAPNLGLI